MATAESVKEKIQGLIDTANATTGNADATLAAAIGSLVAGFGAGGSDEGISGVSRGTITRTSNWLRPDQTPLTIEHGLGVRPRAIIMYPEVLAAQTYALRYLAVFREAIGDKELYSGMYGRISSAGGVNNDYTSFQQATPAYCGSDVANWNETEIVITASNTALVVGVTYHWIVVG